MKPDAFAVPQDICAESQLMRIMRLWGLEHLAWSARRLYCPVPADALVLEIGSGGNPYSRADVLLDAYEATRERHWVPLVSDRPTVLGLAENLPFCDKAFDFVIASHVLEHSSQPECFLAELQRVAHAGYIEVPDAFMERVNPYRDHRLEITVRDGALLIRKKQDWKHDPELVELYEHRAKHWVTRELIPNHPFEFHVRYYWHGEINFVVINPEVDASWRPPADARVCIPTDCKVWRRLARNFLRRVFSWGEGKRTVDLIALLRCPACHGTIVQESENQIKCKACGRSYPVIGNIPRLFADSPQ